MRLVNHQILLLAAVLPMAAQSLADHIVWDRTYPELAIPRADAAAVDPHGMLWMIAAAQILRILPDGKLLGMTEIPAAGDPKPPSQNAHRMLAITPRGKVGLLIGYEHFAGRVIYPDEAKFAAIEADGKVGTFAKIASAGVWWHGLLALTDEHFLALGDQDPATLIRFDEHGRVSWRRSFPSKLFLANGAALENGASCVVSGMESTTRIMRLNSAGVVTRGTNIAARRASAAAGPANSCTVLYELEPAFKKGEFYLTNLDANFRRVWTTPVRFPAPGGGEYDLMCLTGGYAVAAQADNGTFLAKYDFAGNLLWSVLDQNWYYGGPTIASGDSFYLLGAKPTHRFNLHVLRMR